jgi:DNA-binding PadR family transcriptional regulator
MLYRSLARLVEAGLVIEIDVPRGAEPGGGRPRYFRITAAGRRACAAEAEQLASFVKVARQKKLIKA